jgi:hypothetical protein
LIRFAVIGPRTVDFVTGSLGDFHESPSDFIFDSDKCRHIAQFDVARKKENGLSLLQPNVFGEFAIFFRIP